MTNDQQQITIWPDEEILGRCIASLREYEDQGRELLARNPLESLLSLVAGGALIYYLAERERNDKVQTYWDALEYVSTCASVGYSNIFPATPVGKIVASALFIFGPTLTAKVLDQPASRPTDIGAEPFSRDTVASTLSDILAELRKLNGNVAIQDESGSARGG